MMTKIKKNMEDKGLISSDVVSEEVFLTIYESLEEIDPNLFRLIDIDFDLTKLIDFLSDNPVFQNPTSAIYKQLKNLLILMLKIPKQSIY